MRSVEYSMWRANWLKQKEMHQSERIIYNAGTLSTGLVFVSIGHDIGYLLIIMGILFMAFSSIATEAFASLMGNTFEIARENMWGIRKEV